MDSLEELMRDNQFLVLTKLLQKETQTFNLFEVLQYSDYEIRHSNVIGWLLHPNGSHGTGNSFLEAFCMKTFGDVAMSTENMAAFTKANDIEVHRETFHHLDILVVSRSSRSCLAIENKFGSLESVGQTSRYRAAVEKEFDGFAKWFVFLTPNGLHAQDNSWVPQDYQNVIDAIKEVQHKVTESRVKDFLDDYVKVVTKKLNQWNGHPAVLARELAGKYQAAVQAGSTASAELGPDEREAIQFILATSTSSSGLIADVLEKLLEQMGFRVAKRGRKFPYLWVNFHSPKLLETFALVSPEQNPTEFTYSLRVDITSIVFHVATYGKKTVLQERLAKEFEKGQNKKSNGFRSFLREQELPIKVLIGTDGKPIREVAEAFLDQADTAIEEFERVFCDPLLANNA